ncbi:unnamed protein product, partial [Fusarium langsethiae]
MQISVLLPFLSLFPAGSWAKDTVDSSKRDSQCKCIPGQNCWPSPSDWRAFDKKVDGGLIKTQPIAQSCYPGPAEDLRHCAYVNKMWSDQDFQSSDPIGRPYPQNITCAPVDYSAGQEPTTCSLGSSPVYA